ncbi:MAG: RNA polymerase sigma factor [bacterium]|jgi:RNA polymerase sigma factor (sigma-70 family)
MTPKIKQKISEEELIYLLKIKDTSALEYLYDYYSKALYNVIYQIVQSEEVAEDVLQETFIKIWNSFEMFDTTKGRLYTWFSNIARNLSIDKVRSKEFRNQSQNQDIENHVNVIDVRINHAFNTETLGLKELVNKLRPEYKQLIELIYFNGFTHAEVAEHLDMPLGTVKARIRAAILELRKYFN